MRLSPPVVDGLWYCLCPSYRPLQLHRSIRSFKTARETSRRCLSSASTIASTRVPLGERHKHGNSYSVQNSFSHQNQSSSRKFTELQSQSIGDLETQLEQSTSRGRIDISKTVAILKELLQRHRVTPTTRHYKAYLLANIDRQYGSAKNVQSLLQEMAEQGITADSATLHAALEVLAIHPDYLLRQEVIEALRARWLSLSPAGWHHVIAGLLRENQLELALDRLDQMERKGILLEQWLHSLLVYKLCDANEFSEALRLIRSRPNKAKSISSAMWLYLLRAAIRKSHFETVEYVWKNSVDLGYQELSVADCRDVLGFAAQHGDAILAEAIFRHLSTLQAHLTAYEYEKLVQVYAGNADIKSAFQIVCQMHKHNIPIESESVQPILKSMETTSSDPTIVWKDIRQLENEGFGIPITLANIVLEHVGTLFKGDSLSASRAIDVAVSIYMDLFDVCTSGANTDTFNHLFSICHQTSRLDICTFFAKEMAALNVPPDQRTLETLILICLESGNRSSAERYLDDLKAHDWELSGTVEEQIRDKLEHASLLRQIVAGPRLQHPEAGLDLCYVTDFLIATSGPSSKYPKRAYRNPTDALVRFLDSKHDTDWAIWEFRAEGTGYPDSEVYGRIHHFPWPDHHPPPFALIPAIMASMRNWLNDETPNEAGGTKKKKRVAVVHCKAGKGRSGTVACSYLISQEGWKMEDAMQRFTERRMRVGFGDGVSIPSQIRWVGYVNRWANDMGKVYVERPVEILEVHVWGLRDGVKIALEGYVDEGKKIKCFHLFRRKERIVIDDGKTASPLPHADLTAKERLEKRERVAKSSPSPSPSPSSSANSATIIQQPSMTFTSSTSTSKNIGENNKKISAAILRPDKPVILPTSDVNIDFERRIKAAYTGWAVVTSIAHVWFNAYFEGGDQHDSGIFECDWEALDGIKGSSSKGTKALEKVKIVWRYASKEKLAAEGKQEPAEIAKLPEERVVTLPKLGEPVQESHAADWHGENVVREDEPGMGFEGHRSVANPTSSPVRQHPESGHPPSSTEAELEEDEEEALNGATHPFIAQASASTAAAVTSAVKRVRRELGLRKQTAASAEVSLANSSAEDLSSPPSQHKRNEEEQGKEEDGKGNDSDMEGVQPYLDREGNGNTNTSAAKDL